MIKHLDTRKNELVKRAIGFAINMSEELQEDSPFEDSEHETLVDTYLELWPEERKCTT